MNFFSPGEIGEKYEKVFNKLYRALDLPKGAKSQFNYPEELVDKILRGEPLWDDSPLKKDSDDEDADYETEREALKGPPKLTDEEKRCMQLYGEGKYHILPSFFRTLIFLKKQKRDFSVCFRTFGQDLSDVIWEFNEFSNGNHPCFNGKNGTPLIKFDGT